jgi:probable selenium-dependent hydroxylase accessory protein YqeC
MILTVTNWSGSVKEAYEGEWRERTLWELLNPTEQGPIAVVGAGGKSALLAATADQAKRREQSLLLTVTTRLALAQASMADRTVYLDSDGYASLPSALGPKHGEVVLLARKPLAKDSKIRGVSPDTVDQLAGTFPGIPLVVEADGAAGADLKIPGAGEPVIPSCAATVVVVTGLPALGLPLGSAVVHRRQTLAALFPGQDRVSPYLLSGLLTHPEGAFKGAPPGARRIWLVNKAEGARETARAMRFVAEVCEEWAAAGPGADTAAGAPGAADRRRSRGPDLAVVGSLRSGTLAAKELLHYYVHREMNNGAL